MDSRAEEVPSEQKSQNQIGKSLQESQLEEEIKI
jgi:hypothetical protein